MVDNIEDNTTIKTPEPVPGKEEKTDSKPGKEKEKKPREKKQYKHKETLSIKEKAFCREYAKIGNATQAIKNAGYKCKNDNAASSRASQLLRNSVIKAEIDRILAPKEKKAIMDAQEVMELFTAIARGEVKDQFGLEASLNDRLKAMNELAKRTIDIENRIKGVADNNVHITIDWKKKDG